MINEAFIVLIAGALIQTGVVLATVRFLGKRQDEYQKATRSDLNGLGKICRANDAKQERRWLFDIADAVEAADDEKQRTRLAARIRHEAFRH